jgi:hypothetical protein
MGCGAPDLVWRAENFLENAGTNVVVFPDVLLFISFVYFGDVCFYKGHAVAQLVKTLRYKPEGCGFDFRWCHWNFL